MKKVSYILMVALMSVPFIGFTQSEKHNVDFGLGMTMLHGDIESANKAVVNFGYKYYFSELFGFYAGYKNGSLYSNNPELRRQFDNKFWQLSARLELNITNFLLGNKAERSRIALLGNAGLGYMNNDSRDLSVAKVDRQNGTLPTDYSHSESALVFPIGGTLQYYVTKSAAFSFDVGVNVANSDKLDNFYPDISANQSNDAYSYYTLGFSLKFGDDFDILK